MGYLFDENCILSLRMMYKKLKNYLKLLLACSLGLAIAYGVMSFVLWLDSPMKAGSSTSVDEGIFNAFLSALMVLTAKIIIFNLTLLVATPLLIILFLRSFERKWYVALAIFVVYSAAFPMLFIFTRHIDIQPYWFLAGWYSISPVGALFIAEKIPHKNRPQTMSGPVVLTK